MKTRIVYLILAVVSGIFSPLTLACTDFKFTTADNTIIIGRSLEFNVDLKSNIITSLRGRKFANNAPNGKPALSWQAKYGYVLIDGFNLGVAVDGLNEQGLSFEALFLPGETEYQALPEGQEGKGVLYAQFGDWVLSNFKAVAEVRQAMPSIIVYSQKLPQLGGQVLPCHAVITDATGQSIVIEFIGGQVKIYDSVGVATNSPAYPWQTTNLRNYINLSPNTPQPVVNQGFTFPATGQGAGAVGLPGDYSPPSRFVKANFLVENVKTVPDATTGVNLAQHILNNFDIPLGVVRSTSPTGQESMDSTEWIVVKDLTHKKIYFRSYYDLSLRMVDLNKLNLGPDGKVLKMPVAPTPVVVDMTSEFK